MPSPQLDRAGASDAEIQALVALSKDAPVIEAEPAPDPATPGEEALEVSPATEAEPEGTTEVQTPQVRHSFSILAKKEAKLRQREAQFTERLAKAERIEQAMSRILIDPMGFFEAAGVPFDKVTDAASAQLSNPEALRVRQAEARIAQMEARAAQAEQQAERTMVEAAVKSTATAGGDKYELTTALGAEWQAINAINQAAKRGEVLTPQKALDQVEAKLEQELINKLLKTKKALAKTGAAKSAPQLVTAPKPVVQSQQTKTTKTLSSIPASGQRREVTDEERYAQSLAMLTAS